MQHHDTIRYLKNIRAKQPWLVLSAADKFHLARSTHPTISHYYSFKASETTNKTFAIPDGCVDILFDCEASQLKASVFGTPIEAVETDIKSGHRYFGVRFTSGTLPDCMNISAEELIQHNYHLLDIIPQAEPLLDAIMASPNFLSQVNLCKHFFESKATRESSQLTKNVIHCIFKHHGSIRIHELAALTNYTIRTIQRLFHADMGISPKQFSRIVRCQTAVYWINHHPEMTFSDIALNLGFSDQSHFLREFKKLVQATPKAYQQQVKHQTYIDRIECY